MKSFSLDIIAIERTAYHGDCESLVIPTFDGEFGILASHQPCVVVVVPGELRYTVGGKTTILAVGEGLAEINETEVNIIVDFAERADEIDMIRAQAALDRAKNKLSAQKSARSVAHAEAALARAIARLRVGGKNAIH